jgi:hypothetical protein
VTVSQVPSSDRLVHAYDGLSGVGAEDLGDDLACFSQEVVGWCGGQQADVPVGQQFEWQAALGCEVGRGAREVVHAAAWCAGELADVPVRQPGSVSRAAARDSAAAGSPSTYSTIGRAMRASASRKSVSRSVGCPQARRDGRYGYSASAITTSTVAPVT